MDSRLEQLKQRLRTPLGALAKGDGGGAYQQAVQQGGQWAEEHGGGQFRPALQGRYMVDPPRMSVGRRQLGNERSSAAAGAPPSHVLCTSAGQEQGGATILSREGG